MDAAQAARHFAEALERASVPYAVGGAIAYGFFGTPRGTYDVDLNLAVFKLLFFRGKDLTDVERLLGVAGASLDRAYVRRWLVATVGEGDHRVTKWDELTRAIPPPP